jgi:enamine deaminase RidA (YjgF/YER057c/UK114 family)
MTLQRDVSSICATAWPIYPAAVCRGGFIFLSGVRGGPSLEASSSYADLPEELEAAAQGFVLIDEEEGAIAADASAVHRGVDRILASLGCSSDQILRQRMWQRDKRYFPVLERVRKHYQPQAAPSSGLGVKSPGGHLGRWYGLDAIAIDVTSPESWGPREVLVAADNRANPSVSIYSQVVATGPFAFLAGHIPIRSSEAGKPVVAGYDDVPEAGRFLATGRSHPDSRDGPIAAQTWFVYNEIRNALESHGMTMSDILHVRVYLSDLRDLATFHRVHTQIFAGAGPALCITGFDEVGHKGCRIEIEPTALRTGTLERLDIGWPCPAPFLGPSAVRAGPVVFFAGLLGLGPEGRIARDAGSVDASDRDFLRSLESLASTPDLPAQAWWAWKRLQQVCEASGAGIEALTRVVVYLREECDISIYEAVRALFMPTVCTSFDAVFIHGPGPIPAAAIQIDAIAVVDDAHTKTVNLRREP